MDGFIVFVLSVAAWVGHACVWVSLLNNLYGRPLSKKFLKRWRLFTGVVIVAFPAILASPLLTFEFGGQYASLWFIAGFWTGAVVGYTVLCLIIGGLVFPAITVARLRRKIPDCVASRTRTRDLWPELGAQLIGDGHFAQAARLPGNGIFRVDFTELTLTLPELPPEWDGLTLLVLSDLHFHGTPSRLFFDTIIGELASGPVPDLVCLLGDYVDTDTHHAWIVPILGRLTATEAKLAILGNHDVYHNPDRVRAELATAGYTVIGNTWREVTIRGVRCVVVGHEGPWFASEPDLTAAPRDTFRLALSHTPDNLDWATANDIRLMLCGHVHGGQIRLPGIGSIFVPSVYGRRYDTGVFEKSGTVMAVSRGLSGKEPLRFRCNPQVLRITLRRVV